MTVTMDPEENETRALFSFVDLNGRRVLEIGCGEGRLTWRYADRAAQVTAIEPFAPALARARENLPQGLESRVTLHPIAFDEFAAATASSTFDVAIFSWSLCCMEADDMVPALEEAHRLVAPRGIVIDIHPVPGTATVEVYHGGEVVFADSASASGDEGEVRAGEALAHVVARGLFVVKRRAEFDFRVYASSPRELRDFLAEADAHASPVDGERSDAYETDLYERVQRMTTAERTETEVAYHERARITRVRRIGPDCWGSSEPATK
jgi:SAM-dependent methyltransferase